MADDLGLTIERPKGTNVSDVHVLIDGTGRRPATRAEGRLWERLCALEAEVRRALYLTPLGEVMGRGMTAGDVPIIAALLRAEPPGATRG